jgi:hypothetical protein
MGFMKPVDILIACVAANHPNDGINEMTLGGRGGRVVRICDDCFRAYNAAASAERRARKAAPRVRRPLATTGAGGEWNAFAALVLAASAGTLPR